MTSHVTLELAAESFASRFGTSWESLATVVIATALIYLMVIAASRVLGLRSFAKMTAFDFAATVATGSIIASSATGSVPLAAGVVAVIALFVMQGLIAKMRAIPAAKRVIDNEPLLLAEDGQLIEKNMRAAMIEPDDLRAKMRKAGITRLEDLALAVLETSGDVSLMSTDDPRDDWLTEDVVRDIGDAVDSGG